MSGADTTNLDRAAELALLGVSVAVVGGFARLYEHGAALGDLVVVAIVAHLVASVARRLSVPPIVAAVAAVGVGAVLISWLLFPDTLAAGLPTTTTWHAAGAAFREAGQEFRTVAAPTDALVGFQLTAAVAIWGAAWFADWAAFRLGATVEAVAPTAIIFVFCSILGSGEHQVAATLVYLGAVLVFATLHRTRRSRSEVAWLARAPGAGGGAVLRNGLALAAVALLIGAVVGPRIPGASESPLVHWRARATGNGQRTTVSPIVDLRKRLVTQSDVELFRVRANRAAYWRLTSLDRFDGQLWSSGGEYTVAGSELPEVGAQAARTREVHQVVRVSSLSAIWAPVAFEARSVRSASTGLRWDAQSATLIVDSSTPTSDGTVYEAVSEAPILDEAVLRKADGPIPPAITSRYLDLPLSFPGPARTEARQATLGASTRYDQARMLQDWFRSNFIYSLDVPAGHSDDAITAFLGSRTGYCEQFAGTYAAMARSLGLPARVAVGFTPGEADPADPDTFVVRGRHAHAWPEVYLGGIGWVPFEPTPGRGMPDAQEYTGVPPEQDDGPPTLAPSTTTPSTTAPTTTAPSGANQPDLPRNQTVTGPAAEPAPSRSPWPRVLFGVFALILLWFGAVLAAPSLRRLVRRDTHHGGRRRAVADAWQESLAPVRWRTGASPSPAETHDEFARRCASGLDDLAAPFEELAALATRSAWDPEGPDAADPSRARALAEQIRHETVRQQSAVDRTRRRLDWREAFEKA